MTIKGARSLLNDILCRIEKWEKQDANQKNEQSEFANDILGGEGPAERGFEEGSGEEGSSGCKEPCSCQSQIAAQKDQILVLTQDMIKLKAEVYKHGFHNL